MKIKILYSISILFVPSFFLISCSSQMKDGTKKVTLRFLCEPNPIREKQIALFEEEHPDIKVKAEIVAQGRFEKILTGFAGNTAPDVFFLMGREVPDYAVKKVLVDLTPFITGVNPVDISKYFPNLIDAYKLDGKQYAMPGNATPMVLFYNKDMFDEANIAYPDGNWTWADFLDTAKGLTRRDEKGNIIRFGAVLFLELENFYPLLKQNGGEFYNNEGTRCIVNSEPAMEVLSFFEDLMIKHHVAPRLSEFGDVDYFKMKKAAITVTGRWKTIEFRKVDGLNFRIAPLFYKKQRAGLLVSMGWGMSIQSKHKAEAWELIKFLSGRESMDFVIESGDGIPAIMSMAESREFIFNPMYPEENNIVYTDEMKYAVPYPISRYIQYERVWQIVRTEFDKFQLGKQSASQTLVSIENNINKIMKENQQEENKE